TMITRLKLAASVAGVTTGAVASLERSVVSSTDMTAFSMSISSIAGGACAAPAGGRRANRTAAIQVFQFALLIRCLLLSRRQRQRRLRDGLRGSIAGLFDDHPAAGRDCDFRDRCFAHGTPSACPNAGLRVLTTA